MQREETEEEGEEGKEKKSPKKQNAVTKGNREGEAL